MAKTFLAPFAQTLKTGLAVVTDASTNTNTNTPTNLKHLLTAGPNGALVTKISANNRSSLDATSLRLFVLRSGSSRMDLVKTIAAPSKSLTLTNPFTPDIFDGISESTPLRLGAGDELYVGAGVVSSSAGIVFLAEYTDF